MLKRITILAETFNDKQVSMMGMIVDALVTGDRDVENSYFCNGTPYGTCLVNLKDQAKQFEILGDIESTETVREIEVIKEIPADIKRDESAKGYVIAPASSIDQLLAEEFNAENTITSKELISMNCSAILAINNGDYGEKSLNKKLYRCMGDFAEYEIGRIVGKNENNSNSM